MNSSFIYPQWPAPAKVVAFTTTRCHGHSQGPFCGLNLATHVADEPERVKRNRWDLSQFLPTEPCWLEQTHGADIAVLTEPLVADQNNHFDGSITFTPEVVCTVLTADCLPILMTDVKGRYVAAVHAGWRGLAAGIIDNTVKQLGQVKPSEVLVWLGPAIGPQCFEVGDDVRDVFMTLSNINQNAFVAKGNKWLANIYQLARNQLQASGIKGVFGGDHCTYSETSRFYSYRRDGECGRMASCIFLASN